MPLPGSTNNPKGRTPGSKNERTKQWDALAKAITEVHADRFNDILIDFMNHDDPEMQEKGCHMFMQVLEYFKPKQARVTHAGDKDEPIIIKIHGNI